MNAKKLLEILSKQWCTTEDFKKNTNVGYNKVYTIRNELIKSLEIDGYILPKGLLPMQKVVIYIKIDIEYLYKVISIEQKHKDS